MTDESKIFGSKSSTHQNSVFNIKPELLKPIGEVYHKEKKLVNSILDLFQDVHISSSTNALALHPTSPPFSSSLSHPYYTESTISVKEKVLWISLINPFDVDASIKKLDEEVSSIPYFIAALGFSQGLQLWLIFPDNIGCQSATQVFSLRNIGFVSIFRFLSNPSPLQSFGESTLDSYANQRPLFLIFSSQTHSNNNSQVLFFPVNFYSLKTGDKVNELKFASVVLDVQCNAHYIVLSLEDKFSILDAKNLKKISNIITHNTPAKSSSLPNYENSASYSILDSSTPFRRNPFCLGKRWLAISQNSTSKWSHPSLGGYKNSVQSTYTSSVLKAAQSLTRGFSDLTSSFLNYSIRGTCGNRPYLSHPHTSSTSTPLKQGYVTILDLKELSFLSFGRNQSGSSDLNFGIDDCIQAGVNNLFSSSSMFLANNTSLLVAHFKATDDEICSYILFDPSQRLLFVSGSSCQTFNIFSISPHPCYSHRSIAFHVYTLLRGETSAIINSVSFSRDSKLVAVSSNHGTTHLYPLVSNFHSQNLKKTLKSQNIICNPITAFKDGNSQTGFPKEQYNSFYSKSTPNIFERSPHLAQSVFRKCGNFPQTIHPISQIKYPFLSRFDPKSSSSAPSQGFSSDPKFHHVSQLQHLNPNSAFHSSFPNCSPLNSLPSPNPNSSFSLPIPLLNSYKTNVLVACIFASSAHRNIRSSSSLKGSQPTFSSLPSFTYNNSEYQALPVDSLYILTEDGCLTEHQLVFRLSPQATPTANSNEKVSNYFPYVRTKNVTSQATLNFPTSLYNKFVNNFSSMHSTATCVPCLKWELYRTITMPELAPPFPDFANSSFISLFLSRYFKSYHGDNIKDQALSMNRSRDYENSISSFSIKKTSQSFSSSKDRKHNKSWSSYIETKVYAGPHRKLWMGPQFIFKTFQCRTNTMIITPDSSALISSASFLPTNVEHASMNLVDITTSPSESSFTSTHDGSDVLDVKTSLGNSTSATDNNSTLYSTPAVMESSIFETPGNCCLEDEKDGTVSFQVGSLESTHSLDLIKQSLHDAMHDDLPVSSLSRVSSDTSEKCSSSSHQAVFITKKASANFSPSSASNILKKASSKEIYLTVDASVTPITTNKFDK